jgi:hypothetical protein
LQYRNPDKQKANIIATSATALDASFITGSLRIGDVSCGVPRRIPGFVLWRIV